MLQFNAIKGLSHVIGYQIEDLSTRIRQLHSCMYSIFELTYALLTETETEMENSKCHCAI